MLLQKAILISRNTQDGWEVIRDEVPLGKVYYVDLESVTTLKHVQMERSGQWTVRECIWVCNTPEGGEGGYLPLELLKIEAVPED